uniref:Transmembrane protein n=1 Tax=Steinernema glaseri TaxID=37863 RepID=A0A1I8AD25_9BILA
MMRTIILISVVSSGSVVDGLFGKIIGKMVDTVNDVASIVPDELRVDKKIAGMIPDIPIVSDSASEIMPDAGCDMLGKVGMCIFLILRFHHGSKNSKFRSIRNVDSVRKQVPSRVLSELRRQLLTGYTCVLISTSLALIFFKTFQVGVECVRLGPLASNTATSHTRHPVAEQLQHFSIEKMRGMCLPSFPSILHQRLHLNSSCSFSFLVLDTNGLKLPETVDTFHDDPQCAVVVHIFVQEGERN